MRGGVDAARSPAGVRSVRQQIVDRHLGRVDRHRLIQRQERGPTDGVPFAAKRLDTALTDFVRVCRKDLGADPDDPERALQTV